MKKVFLIAFLSISFLAFIKPQGLATENSFVNKEIVTKGCKIDNNLDKTVIDFIGSCVKGSVWEEIPDGQTGKYAKMTLRKIKKNRSKNNYKTVWKLISRAEYRK